MATTVETALPASSDTYRSLTAKRLAILAGLSLCLVLSIAELPPTQPIAVVGVIGAPSSAPATPALAAPEATEPA